MSIHEIAREAGVSTATVSRVMNRREGVSEASERLVLAAMDRLAYRPAKRRRGRPPRQSDGLRFRNIALLMTDTNPGRLHLPIFADVLQGLQGALSSRQINFIFSHASEPQMLPPCVVDGRVDGLVMLGQAVPGDVAEKLRHLPTVWLLTRPRAGDPWGDRVQPDNAAIGQLAADYLLSRGCRDAAYVRLNPDHPAFIARHAAFEAAMGDAGGRVEVLAGEPTRYAIPKNREHNNRVIDALIAQYVALSPRPAGLFLPSDSAVPAAYRSLEQRGLRPQHDVIVVTCDNARGRGADVEPPPGMIDIGAEAIGRTAAERLLWRIQHGASEPQACISIAPRLMPAMDEPSSD